jgi:hypothetical protein
VSRGNGVDKSDGAAKGARPNNPREAAARHDEALLALMRANPEASVTQLIRMSGRPRNSTVLSLDRLEKAGSSSTPDVANGSLRILICSRSRPRNR